MPFPSVALIGSFRRYLPEIQHCMDVFTDAGIEVIHPRSTEPLEPGIDFVRFPTDEPTLSDAEIQEQAMQRILAASAIYAVCPQGYIGRTTCYEVGRIVDHSRPLYFSDPVDDPPHLRVPSRDRQLTAQGLAELILTDRLTSLELPPELL